MEALLATGEFEALRWPVPPEWNVSLVEDSGVFAMRFLPHRTPGEGFFISALKRVSHAPGKRSKPRNVFNLCGNEEKRALQKHEIDADQVVLAPDGELYRSTFSKQELNVLAGSLYFISPGVHIGKVVRGEFIPAHALALANFSWLSGDSVELDEAQALAYLRGESISVDASSGWHHVAFQSCPLGWIKVIGNRVNNYYPKEWRVKLRE